ncbi:hypothetical protein RF11_07400 [Thelohanellus kitauei]|uniref:Uncharacterized protein n=1 Tax=Thelohanellus kitauei TaxID=669202 RepID=A0A0C2NGK8_THEKT|nr:hypothetical protein RF11_07400 [Thelohanellus kitauei]
MEKLTATKICSIVALVIFLVDLFFNAAAMFPGPLLALFFNNNAIATAAAFLPSAITPSRWVFFIWILIYFYQLAWIVFALIIAFSKKTCIVPLGSYVGFIFASVFNFIWLITYAFNQIVSSFIIIFLLFASITFAAYWGSIYIGRCSHEEMCRKTKFILHIIFLNGLFLYWAWIVVAMHLVLDNVFVYSGVPVFTSGAVVLAILLAFQIAAFVVDLLVLRKAMINVLVVFPTFMVALVAMITEAGPLFLTLPGEIVGLIITNLIVSITFFLVKIFRAVRHKRSHHGISHVSNKA